MKAGGEKAVKVGGGPAGRAGGGAAGGPPAGRGARGGTIPGEVPHDIDLDPYFGNVGDRVFDAGRRFADIAEDPNAQAAVQGIANMGGNAAINRFMALAGAATLRAGGVPPPIANTLATVGTGLGVNPINAIARAGANRLVDAVARPPGAPPALPNIGGAQRGAARGRRGWQDARRHPIRGRGGGRAAGRAADPAGRAAGAAAGALGAVICCLM
jgi:hypothetical protein